jgi:predicted metal-binding membrane protein
LRSGILIPLGGILLVLTVCWGYVARMAWGMRNMGFASDWGLMPRMSHWSGTDLALVFAMWAIMMVAMMLPAAVPMLVRVAQPGSHRDGRTHKALATSALALGYVAPWIGFSALAALAQWLLLEARLVSPMMASSSPYLSALLLAAAGAYQFTPWKEACLARCRSRLGVLRAERGNRIASAFRFGLDQGAWCMGCCWLLMTLLFVLGVMNLVWIVVLTALVLVEQSLFQPRWFVRVTGVALLVWGALVLVRGLYLLH